MRSSIVLLTKYKIYSYLIVHSTNQIKTIENYVKSKEERSKGQGQQVGIGKQENSRAISHVSMKMFLDEEKRTFEAF